MNCQELTAWPRDPRQQQNQAGTFKASTLWGLCGAVASLSQEQWEKQAVNGSGIARRWGEEGGGLTEDQTHTPHSHP